MTMLYPNPCCNKVSYKRTTNSEPCNKLDDIKTVAKKTQHQYFNKNTKAVAKPAN